MSSVLYDGWNSLPSMSDTSRHTVSAQIAAAASTLLFYPFDSVKLRIMSQDGTALRRYHHTGHDFTGTLNALVETVQVEGTRALFRGALIAVVGSVVSWGIYMYFHKYTLELLYGGDVGGSRRERWFMADYGSSLVASLLTACCTNPIWLVKVRMQLQDRTNKCDGVYYSSFWHGARHILMQEGPRGLFRGLLPQMMLSVPNAVYLPLYELLKHCVVWYYHGIETPQIVNGPTASQIGPVTIILCTVLAKAAVAVLSNPLLVIKTRIQDHRNHLHKQHQGEIQYLRIRDTIRTTLMREGFLSGLLFRGLSANLAQTIPRSIAHVLVYESLLKLLFS